MKTELSKGCLIIRDQPLPFWAFYSFFVAGGLLALFLSILEAPSRLALLAGSVIGIGNVAGGLYMIRREPASIVEVDRGSEEIRISRWTPAKTRRHAHPLSALRCADVETSEHTDGGAIYRPRLCLEGSSRIPVSVFWYQRKEPSEAIAREINDFLALPRA